MKFQIECLHTNPTSLIYKGLGGIFVYKDEEVSKVLTLITEVFGEFSARYFNIPVVKKLDLNDDYQFLEHVGKFDNNLQPLYNKCKEEGIEVIVFTLPCNQINENISVKKMLKKEIIPTINKYLNHENIK